MPLTATQKKWLRNKLNMPQVSDDYLEQFGSNPDLRKAMDADLPYEARYSQLPDEIQYQQAYDPNTMSIMPDLQKKLDAIQLNKQGLEKFRGEALRSGESAWAQMAKRGLAMDSQANAENLLRGAQGRAAEARSGMARRGGIGAGSNERLGRAAMKEGLLAQQGAYRDRTRGMLDIGMTDEKNRIGQLGQLPGMELAALQPEMEKTSAWAKGRQFDIGNALGEAQAKNKFAMDQWQKKMEAYGTLQTADAQRAASDGGISWLCTESAKRGNVNDADRKALGKLTRYAMQRDRAKAKFYFSECFRLVNAMKADGYSWDANDQFVKAVVEKVEAGDLAGAYDFYDQQMTTLLAKHWPEGYHSWRKFRSLKETA